MQRPLLLLALLALEGASALSLGGAPSAFVGQPALGALASARNCLTKVPTSAGSGGAVARQGLRGGAATTMGLNIAQAAKTGTLAYAVLVGAGGVFAGIKSGSKPSIISGVTAAILLAIAYTKNNNPLALGTAAALTVVFSIRYVKTKKVMPAGFLGVLSALFGVLFGMAQFR